MIQHQSDCHLMASEMMVPGNRIGGVTPPGIPSQTAPGSFRLKAGPRIVPRPGGDEGTPVESV